MSWIDLLRMSSSSLKRRKLRTFLTVLGVVIGTASIVVMISLGLGMQESMYKEIEQSGGMTAITVTGKEAGSQMIYTSASSGDEEATKYLTDDMVEQLRQLEYVKSAAPTITMSSIILKGKYIGYIQLVGMEPQALRDMNLELNPGGTIFKEKGAALDLVVGNGIISMFYEKATGKGYWETGQLPDIDFAKDQMFLILDQDSYMNSQQNSNSLGTGENSSGQGGGEAKKPVKAPKKYVVKASGVVAGDMNSYSEHYYNVYCDINKLKDMLKKEYSGRVIPGQPTTKTGKPYKDFAYSSVRVQADDIEHVDAISGEIRNMGFNVRTNAELMDSMKRQFAMIQAVLGGIGAVSLFVAAIGIANTMMMSIYERTKEIGVIKVLGCSLKNIKQLFLLEAAFIGFLGGIIGNILSALLSVTINVLVANSNTGVTGNISYIPLWLVGASMIFAVFVGMAAGYFPALRAMRLSPLAAISNN